MSDDLTTYADEFSDTVSVGVAERGLRAGFTPVTNEWLDREDVTGEAKLIYAIFCRMAWQVGHCTPDVKLFQKLTGFGEKSIRKAIAELVELGAVAIKRRGQGKSNFYSVRLIFQNGQKDDSRSGTLDSESQNGQKDDSRTVRMSNLERPKGGTTYTGGQTGGRPVLRPPGSASNQLELSDAKEDIATAPPRNALSDDPFSRFKLTPIASTNERQTDTNRTANGKAKASGPPKPGTIGAMSDKAQAALVHWCGELGRDPSKLRLNPAQTRRVNTAVERHSLEILATAATWAADKGIADVLTWARAADTIAANNDPNHVRGTQSKGKDHAAAIRDNGHDPRALRLTASQRANAEALAAQYPNLKG